MNNEKFYICYEEGVKTEVYEKLFKNAEDSRIINLDDYAIVVKAEDKGNIELEYGIKFKAFKKDLFDTLKSYGEVDIVVNDLSKEHGILNYWAEASLPKDIETKLINKAIEKLYALSDEEIIDFITSDNYGAILEDNVKDFMISEMIKELNEIKNEKE